MKTRSTILIILNQVLLSYFFTDTCEGIFSGNLESTLLWTCTRIPNAYSATIRNSASSVNPFSVLTEPADDSITSSSRASRSGNPPGDKRIEGPGGWPDYNAEYIEIRVGAEGIYRIRGSDLESAGVNTELVDPRSFGMYCRGEPYPVFVSGESDGSFDRYDYIEFYADRNCNTGYRSVNLPGEPYKEYMNIYTDTTIFWLRWNDEARSRVDYSVNAAGFTADTLTAFTQIDHYERNNYLDSPGGSLTGQQLPFRLGNKTWFAGILYEGYAIDNFSVLNVLPGTKARFYCKVIGYSPEAEHHAGVQINDNKEILGESIFEKFQQKILSSEFPSEYLREGINNFRVKLFGSESGTDAIAIDWFDIEYIRRLDLDEKFLKINITNDFNKKFSVLKILNSSGGSVVIYKISPDFKRFSYENASGNYIDISDTVSEGDKYYASAESEILTPVLKPPVKINNLLSENYEAEHIIITHPELKAAAAEYAAFVCENYGIVSKVFIVDDIFNQFNHGFISAEPIKDFILKASANWKNHIPGFVLFIGDANYDFLNYKKIKNYSRNFVPSYGYPVSDTWFVIFDSVLCKPAMPVGRIPARNPEEVLHYLEKHKKYLNEDYCIWNKTHLLISGGKTETEQIFCKFVNDNLKNKLISPAPAGGIVSQLYATSHPPSNFGPFEKSYSDSILSAGGITISYVGHSGTNIWDNGIEDAARLKNFYGRSPLISDFGCSTAKFAEPDIVSFSEEFVTGDGGDAIAYLGNSSLGFLSVSGIVPELFYGELMDSVVRSIGTAHTEAKKKLIDKYGHTQTNEIFVYCNSLIGDPVTRLKIPREPNLNIGKGDVQIIPPVNDNSDSALVRIRYINLGKVTPASFQIVVSHSYSDTLLFRRIFRKTLPLNYDTLLIKLPVRGMAGRHSVEVKLDPGNEITELSELDNEVSTTFEVTASSYLPLVSHTTNTKQGGILYFVPPSSYSENVTDYLIIDSASGFYNPVKIELEHDSVLAFARLSGLIRGTRYHAGFNRGYEDEKISGVFSFIYDTAASAYSMSDSVSFATAVLQEMEIRNNAVVPGGKKVKLKIRSEGNSPGGAAKLEIDNTELAYNPQGCGFHVLLLDAKSFVYHDYRWFNYWNESHNLEEMAEYIKTIPEGKLFITAIGGECGGYGVPESLIGEYEKSGSSFIRKVKWGTSWIFVRGPGFVKEFFSDTSGVKFDTTFSIENRKGSILINPVASAGEWNNIEIKYVGDPGITIKPLRYKSVPDTIAVIRYYNTPVDLRFLNQYMDEQIAFLIEAERGTGDEYEISEIDINFKIKPDLTLSNLPVEIPGDTLSPGTKFKFSFHIANAGETTARNFNSIIEYESTGREPETFFTIPVDSLPPLKILHLEAELVCPNNPGMNRINIRIDPENRITEFCEGNNYRSIGFFITEDKSVPEVKLTFDGEDIADGDFVSAKPEIRVELYSESLLPVNDTNAVAIYLDGSRIGYSDGRTQYSFHPENPKMIVELSPEFTEGAHSIRITGLNTNVSNGEESVVERSFTVSGNISPLYVYNFPNPFSDYTCFTFKLAVIPDELSINIYTVAGRLVKKIAAQPNSLKYDFNRLDWDGRDADGDPVGNGVYLYKINLTSSGRSASVTGKLAVVR